MGAATVPLSFRIPDSVSVLLEDRVAKLIAAGEIKNRTEALQDALTCWLMIEEHQEQLRAAAPGIPGGVPLEEIVDAQAPA